MSQELSAEAVAARLRKLARIEQLAQALEQRWQRVGRLGPVTEALRELLNECKKQPKERQP